MSAVTPVIRRAKGYRHRLENEDTPVLDLSSGYTFRAFLRDSADGRKLAEFSVVTTQAASGIIDFELTAAQTAAIPASCQTVAYDIEVTIGSQQPVTLAEFHGIAVAWQATR